MMSVQLRTQDRSHAEAVECRVAMPSKMLSVGPPRGGLRAPGGVWIGGAYGGAQKQQPVV
ncbi:hypothetical protein GCM10010497_58490 [Streptomyces cinereoruber]|uniref:Uncharacterized protein n=1 Tax=Streptomyces cinereoruber TaxID=67260 RepID=A0AAV4KSW4_9ACTN|nr:hypothetical protein GCM10010497_58490 [Streptomyces cinereoruber]